MEIGFTNKDGRFYVIQVVRQKDEWGLFLYNDEGEGMSITEEDIFNLLDRHFKERF